MLPVVPLLLVGVLAGGAVGVAVGSRTCAARNGFAFADRGWSVLIEPEDGAWTWTATKQGHAPGEDSATTKLEALDASRAWITAQQLPSLPVPTPSEPTPPIVPRPPLPTPVGGGFPNFPIPPTKAVAKSGIKWDPKTNVVVLMDLQAFVAAAFGASDPWTDDPREVVRAAIAQAVPSLSMEKYGDTLKITTAAGNQLLIDEAAKLVDELQFQLNSEDLPPEAIPFAADILHEGIFDIEQQQSKSPFAFRGRLLVARVVAGGFISTIITPGSTVNGTTVVPTEADAIGLGIKTVSVKDGFA